MYVSKYGCSKQTIAPTAYSSKKVCSKRKKKRKRFWVRRLFAERKTKGEFYLLIRDLRLFDSEYFFKYYRMSNVQYEEVLRWVAPRITKCTQKREPIGPSERLSVTLRYLTTGDAHITIAMAYRMSPTTVGRIIKEICSVLWSVIGEKGYLQVPNSVSKWKKIAADFQERWNFNYCIGAIDGKHVVMQAPPNSGSLFFNYKKTHSIVLMAVCDAKYTFTMVDIGDTGRNSDGGVLNNGYIGQLTNNPTILTIPIPETINGLAKLFPYVIVGDDAFPLKTNLLKPYPRETLRQSERIYNYRLSRARRVIENCFGIAASRFRVFRRPIIAKVETVVDITKAIVALHNYLIVNSNMYCPNGYVDSETNEGRRPGDWRREVVGDTGLVPVGQIGSNNYTKNDKDTRDDFRDYFSSPAGQVPWQWGVY